MRSATTRQEPGALDETPRNRARGATTKVQYVPPTFTREERGVMKIRPLHDRILVERVEAKDVGRGGIIIPDTAKEKPQEGKVVAAGTGKLTDEGKRLALDVQVGDRILFGKYSGSEVTLDDVEYVIMREEDILAILN